MISCANCGKMGDWAKYCSVSCACTSRNKSMKQRAAVAITNIRDGSDRMHKTRTKNHRYLGMTLSELSLYVHPEFPDTMIPQCTPYKGSTRVADFVDFDRKLVIEVEGWMHKKDLMRKYEFALGGFIIITVYNNDIQDDIDNVVKYINYRISLHDNNYKEIKYA